MARVAQCSVSQRSERTRYFVRGRAVPLELVVTDTERQDRRALRVGDDDALSQLDGSYHHAAGALYRGAAGVRLHIA